MATLNSTPPQLMKVMPSLDWSGIAVQVHKYKPLDIENVMALDSNAKQVLFEMMSYLDSGYKSTLFDYKVADLRSGDCGCKLPAWHIDVTRNPNHASRPDRHIIFSTEIGTEFLLTPIQTEATDFADVQIVDEKLVQAPADAIVTYNRFNMHRGPKMLRDCKRVLIRITQTDII